MALVERSAIGLDDPVTRWLPEFRPKLPNGGEPVIRVRHLLTHTAGLTYRMLQPAGDTYEQAGISDGLDESTLSIDEEIERIARVPLVYPPGTSWGYSVAYDVLGEVIARAARAPLPDVIATLVTRPLEMRDTAFTVVDPARLAAPYVPATPPRAMEDPEVVPYLPGTAGVRFSPSRILNAEAFPSGGSGMAGTARDLLKLLMALQSDGCPVLSARSAGEMRCNQIGSLRLTAAQQPGWAYGLAAPS